MICKQALVSERIVECYLLTCLFSFPVMVEFQVLAGLNRKAFQCFSSAARKSEEEVQSHSMEHVDVMGVIDAYMTLVGFCDQHLRREEENSLGESGFPLSMWGGFICDTWLFVIARRCPWATHLEFKWNSLSSSSSVFIFPSPPPATIALVLVNHL